MNAAPVATELAALPPRERARRLAGQFAASAVERDARGGTPKAERDALRASGLLGLVIPQELGGLGAGWSETLDIVREIARVDASLAHVFGFQHLLLASLRLFGTERQWQPWFRGTVRESWFWGNALNPLDRRTLAQRTDQGYVFDGEKSFSSGAVDADRLVVSALDRHGRLLIAALPASRAGIEPKGDWDAMGQRQTDSGGVRLNQVAVADAELLLDPGPFSSPFAGLRSLLAQLIFANVFLGIAEGAFAEARDLTRQEAQPWFASGVEKASEDPYVLTHYGEFWLGLEGARNLLERANHGFDAVWNQGLALTAEARGELALKIATAKLAASRIGLSLSSRLFEVTGARAVRGALRLDRYWRNLRTQTLHDPADYKLRELGEWALNGKLPEPSFYS